MILHLCSYHSLVNSIGKSGVSQMIVLTFSSAKADDGMHIANAVKVPTAIFLKFTVMFVFFFLSAQVFKVIFIVEIRPSLDESQRLVPFLNRRPPQQTVAFRGRD